LALRQIFSHCGLAVVRCEEVPGGDINQSFRIDTKDARYFLKLNNAQLYPGMFEKEANGLKALAGSFALKVPQVYGYGIVGNEQFLLLEWLAPGNATSQAWEDFGAALAHMHRQSQESAGWEEDNYIGSLVQYNIQHDNWAVFYTECRILPLVKKLYDTNLFSDSDLKLAEQFCRNAATLFPEEPMALLHGDLWSGNKMFVDGNTVAIFDPAVYYGHREMDLGMANLFGGFDHRFFEAYHSAYPLERNWEERLPITQLYPLLVHALLFGGHYVENALAIIRRFA
jgi:protein-ribulosamine 3-kinase